MHKLAGIRVDPVVGYIRGRHGATSPRLVTVEGDAETPLPLPSDAEILGVSWTADGRRFALTVRHPDHMGLWVGSVQGRPEEDRRTWPSTECWAAACSWLPDQKHLLVRRVPDRGAPPEPPAIPSRSRDPRGRGATARSTYEARNLLETAYDDALFSYFATSELVVVDPETGESTVLGKPAVYATAEFLARRHAICSSSTWSAPGPTRCRGGDSPASSRCGTRMASWVATIASLPLADEVPIHGVPTGTARSRVACHGATRAVLGRRPRRRQSRRRGRAPRPSHAPEGTLHRRARGGLPGRAPHRGLAGRVGRRGRHTHAHRTRAHEALALHLAPGRGQGHLAPVVRPQRG